MCLYSMKDFSAMKKDTFESFVGKQVHLETMVLSEIIYTALNEKPTA